MQTLQGAEPLSEENLVELALALVTSRRVKLIGIYRDANPDAFGRTAKPAV